MALFLYSLLICLAMPFVLLRLWWRGRKEPEVLENWRERFGYVAELKQPVIWVHAVSVGETIAAAPVVKLLRQRHPDTTILVTAMTPTGSERARALFGDSVNYAYVPYDYPAAVTRFLKRVRPRALIIMETELWPNIVARTHATGAPIIVANARLSQRSARGYKKVGWLSRRLFSQLDWIAAQADSDARRFVEAGARGSAVTVTGSIKFDVSVSSRVRDQAGDLRARLGPPGRPIWIAASTHEGEDAQLLAAHRRLLREKPDALLVLVPRHPERFRSVGRLARDEGFSVARRSRQEPADAVQIYLGDTMGELLMLYGVADAAFIGGSLVRRGGHNPLEAAAWEIPVLTGPHVFNFLDIYERLGRGDGLIRAASAPELAKRLIKVLGDDGYRQAVGRNAGSVLTANQGALERLIVGIETKIERRNASS
jgi:3-deoxy-D-manno-octulosonic-acid transferase